MQPTNDVEVELRIDTEMHKTLRAVEEGKITAEEAQGILNFLFEMWKKNAYYQKNHLFAQDHNGPLCAPVNNQVTNHHDVQNLDSRRPSDYSNISAVSNFSSASTAKAPHRKCAQDVNELAARLTKRYNGPIKGPVEIFRPNLKPGMCYIEDVYHTRCQHWSNRPNIYHRCPQAPHHSTDRFNTTPSLASFENNAGLHSKNYHWDPTSPVPPGIRDQPCAYNKTSYGSIKDTENLCPRCRIDQGKRAADQTGMWFAFYYDFEKGKCVIKERNPESEASQKARGVWMESMARPSISTSRKTSIAGPVLSEEEPGPPPRPNMPNFWAAMAQVKELQGSSAKSAAVTEKSLKADEVIPSSLRNGFHSTKDDYSSPRHGAI
ncbi:hypothetical protein H2198_001722 [Neophaeococcomyces mojaviensis]|uniref:Uncharacterized protein n=1 Tax=Neophaeococcomyces mojaviensis TaxID=3383035 RepID=A0ACC3AG07_9EURO|nr:hypothetical protein H2198_001722 [Knufia sp. JES_112]